MDKVPINRKPNLQINVDNTMKLRGCIIFPPKQSAPTSMSLQHNTRRLKYIL